MGKNVVNFSQQRCDKLDPFKNGETLEMTPENLAEINKMMMRIQLHQLRYIFQILWKPLK